MRRFKLFFLSLILLGAGLLHAAPLRVGVSVLPLEGMVQEIGGEWVEARSLAREGDSCSVFEPRPSEISWLAGARIFFRTGVGYETVIMAKIESGFNRLILADLRDAVDLLPMVAHAHDHAGHGHVCAGCAAHGAAETDPHIWLDPARLARMADFIAAQLAEVLPDQAQVFARRAAAFKERVNRVDARLEALLGPHAGKAFFIHHPALGYFADRYRLRQVAVDDSGQGGSARALHARIAEAREAGVRVIFIQPQESRRQAEIIAAAIGARLVEIDPMGADWEASLLHIGESIAAALRE
jgi:zinc transport system substrate-binding protein